MPQMTFIFAGFILSEACCGLHFLSFPTSTLQGDLEPESLPAKYYNLDRVPMYGTVLVVMLDTNRTNKVFSVCVAQLSVAGVEDCSGVRRLDKKEQSHPGAQSRRRCR